MMTKERETMVLPLAAIDFSVLERHNPREFDEEHAVTLARSMNADGIQTPIVVFPTAVIADSVFEGFHTESAYVAATGWHRQWGLRLTAAELAARDIEPDTLPLSEVPCEVMHGTFSEFWAKLFTDNTQFVPGINPYMGKMPTRDEMRRIFEHLCLLPTYLEMSISALSGEFKIARGTADAWRAKVVEGILDTANPYQLTTAYRDRLHAIIESGTRVGLDGKRRQAQVTQKQRQPASPAVAPEPEKTVTQPVSAPVDIRDATLASLRKVKAAFNAHALCESEQMDFETFCDECAYQFVRTPNVLQSLVVDSESPDARDSEANALARGLNDAAFQEWQGILDAIHTALKTDAAWVQALSVNPLDEAVSAFKGGYARLTKQVTAAVRRWHPSEPVPASQPLIDTLIVDIGCQSLYVAMDDADARAAIGDSALSQFQEGTATLRKYSDCFQSDKQVIQHPPAAVLRHTVLKAYRKLEVLEQFAVTEMSALGAGLSGQLTYPDPGTALPVAERLYELEQWELGVQAQVTIERAARIQTYSAAYDALAQAYHVSGEARQFLVDFFNPPLSDKPEDRRPVPTFEVFLSVCQTLPTVWFSVRVPKDTGDVGFFLNLDATTQAFSMLTQVLTESDVNERESLLMSPVFPSDFGYAIEALPDDEGLVRELKERFKAGVIFNSDKLGSTQVWQQKYLLSQAEIVDTVDRFNQDVVEPQQAHADAVTAHEAAYDAARDAVLAHAGVVPGSVSWRDVLRAASEHIDTQVHAEMPRSPDSKDADIHTVRHRTHLLHQVKKGVESSIGWFQHLVQSKAPAPAPAPAQPHYADPSDKHGLSFEELCSVVEEELGILVETYPDELAVHQISVEHVESLRDVLSEVTMTL